VEATGPRLASQASGDCMKWNQNLCCYHMAHGFFSTIQGLIMHRTKEALRPACRLFPLGDELVCSQHFGNHHSKQVCVSPIIPFDYKLQ
jgi:hypothetical protein